MTHVSNLLSTFSLNGLSPHKAFTGLPPQLSHLKILGSTVYVFIYEKERKAKSAKWEPRAKQGLLVGYDGHSIYRVYLEKDVKVIQIKDLKIFEDASTKTKTSLPIYNAIIYTENPPLLLPPSQKSSFETSKAKSIPYTQRSGRVSKPPLRYDAGMNKDIQILMANFNEVLAMPNWRGHDAVDEADPLICLANRL